MSDATLFPLSDPQQVLASLVRAFASTPARRAAVCAWRALAPPRVAVSAYAGGAVGLAPRVAVARAGDGNAAGGDDGNAGRDRRDDRDERDTDAPGGGGDGHPHDDRGGRTGGDGDGDSHDGERKRPGKKPLIILGAVLLVLLIAGLVWWLATRDQESTDDAYTDGNAVAMAPHVSG